MLRRSNLRARHRKPRSHVRARAHRVCQCDSFPPLRRGVAQLDPLVSMAAASDPARSRHRSFLSWAIASFLSWAIASFLSWAITRGGSDHSIRRHIPPTQTWALRQQVLTDYVLPRLPNAQLWMVCGDARRGVARSPQRRRAGQVLPPGLGVLSAQLLRGIRSVVHRGDGLGHVVASPNPGAREVLECGRPGRLSPDADLDRTLVHMLTDEQERNQCVRLGLQAARDQYHWSIVANAYEQLYRRAIEDRRVGA